ncbi:MAG: hypothetical protein R3F48_15565 [Candidatus Zixiibacteriota bacterium]
MSDILQITMLPAKEGDCLLIAYGEEDDRKYILIDGGRAWTYKNALKAYLQDNEINRLELFITTHIDRDHIDGVVELLDDNDLELDVGEIWFNTWDHLQGNAIETPDNDDDIETFGAKMGEELSTKILEKGWHWNGSFGGHAVEIDDDPQENEIQIGDIKLTLLSPDRKRLESLINDWEKECQEAGLAPGYGVEDYKELPKDVEVFGAIDIDELAEKETDEDNSDANGSSIACLLEYKGRRLLLSGDAHIDILIESLKRLGATPEDPLELDAFKIPHHGSKANISKELLDLLHCKNYLVSTNGNYFKHPDDIAMARIVKYGSDDATINFNYNTKYNKKWKNEAWEEDYHYKTNFPPKDEDGYLTVTFTVEDN